MNRPRLAVPASCRGRNQCWPCTISRPKPEERRRTSAHLPRSRGKGRATQAAGTKCAPRVRRVWGAGRFAASLGTVCSAGRRSGRGAASVEAKSPVSREGSFHVQRGSPADSVMKSRGCATRGKCVQEATERLSAGCPRAPGPRRSSCLPTATMPRRPSSSAGLRLRRPRHRRRRDTAPGFCRCAPRCADTRPLPPAAPSAWPR